jgi:hypothetical protein
MIPIVEVNEKNEVVARYSAEVEIPDNVIVLKPGVPSLGTPAFDKWLREWHEINNDRTVVLTAPSATPLRGHGEVA